MDPPHSGHRCRCCDYLLALVELMPLKPSLSLSLSFEEHESGADAGKREDAAAATAAGGHE